MSDAGPSLAPPASGHARFYGKYRGTVQNNVDPMLMGRLLVSVPSVLGSAGTGWAMPCVPFAGPGVGLWFLPPNGADVWVEFEGGDPDYPIWCGGFWRLGQTPAVPAIPQMKVLATDTFKLTINELVPGVPQVQIEVTGSGSVAFAVQGVQVTASPGTLGLSGTLITLNNDGLVVK